MIGVFNPKRLERAMNAKRYTAADLAFHVRQLSNGRLKTTERVVYKWLAGDHDPRDGSAIVVARALDVSVESLYEADGEDDEEAALLRDLQRLPSDLRDRVVAAIDRARVGVSR